MIFQVDPFPDPSHAGQEIEFIGLMFGHLSIMLFMIILMLYLYKKIREILPMLVLYIFSLIFGIICYVTCPLPFFPYFNLFFMVFQSSIIMLSQLEKHKYRKGY